jgi:hypothetical protein
MATNVVANYAEAAGTVFARAMRSNPCRRGS